MLEELKNLLDSFTDKIGAKLNKLLEMLPKEGTLSQLEAGTDTEQRTYTPKDLNEFVLENSVLEKAKVYDKDTIAELVDNELEDSIIPSPGAGKFIHVESVTITPLEGAEFPPNLSGEIRIGNFLQIQFKVLLDDDTVSQNFLNNGVKGSKINSPCMVLFDSFLDVSNFIGEVKFTVRYRIINTS